MIRAAFVCSLRAIFYAAQGMMLRARKGWESATIELNFDFQG